MFQLCKNISGFEVSRRTTIVDQYKLIYSAYKQVLRNANLFLTTLHFKKNMAPKLVSSKPVGNSQYDRGLWAPTTASVDSIRCEYCDMQKANLVNFAPSELYRPYSSQQDTIVISQGAERQMGASLRHHIRAVERQEMLSKSYLVQRAGFMKRQEAAIQCANPVPLNWSATLPK